jgi:putative tryptophan/tyrosine transport system substrate-binding protein
MSRARIWQSSIAGQKIRSLDCRRWPPNWFSARSPSLLRAAAQLRLWLQKRDDNNSNCLHECCRSGGDRLGCKLQPTGRNVTGVTLLGGELVAKRLGILRDLLPSMKRVGMLLNPTRPGVDAQKAQVQEAAQALGLALQILEASSEHDFETVFQTVVSQQDAALIVAPDAFFLTERVQIADLATRYRIATMYELRDFVEAGGLISYGAGSLDLYRQVGTLTGWVLMGKKPADLPVLQPTKFELAINMKTARALGLTISPGLLSIADELIE